jgi:[acyl-carrier-protein] S-malonyltransferase
VRGIRPDVVVGHSVGEFSALGAASTLSVRDAIALVRERGLAMAEAAKQHPGSMAAILGLADEAVEALCHKIHNVWPANYNCPGQLVISGETPSVDEAIDEATLEGARRAIKLRVSGAFHSPLVARAAERLRPAVEKVHLAESKAAFMSTVTARIEEAARYREGLVDQLTAPVRFTQAAREMIAGGVTTFVEVGPGNVLGGLLKRIDKSVRTFSVSDLETLDEVTEALG